MGEALPDELMDTLQHVQIACLEEKKRRAQAAVATAAVAAADKRSRKNTRHSPKL